MGIQINHNLQSLLIQQNLRGVSTDLQTAFERLSSGEKINRAADDPVGMSVSKKLQNQIRGIQQNIRDVNNGISIVSVAESAMSEMSQMLSRMRELTLQAVSDTVDATQRGLIQQEVSQLVQEINELAKTTNFNDKKLLDGSFSDGRVMTGTSSGQYLAFSIPDMRTDILGARAEVTSTGGASATPIAGDGDLIINGVTISASEDDGVSLELPNASGIAKAAAINKHTGQTGVTAEALRTSYSDNTPTTSIGDVVLDGVNNILIINGQNIGAVTVNSADNGAALIAKINQFSNSTGITASVGDHGQLVLEAIDGRKFRVETSGPDTDLAKKLGITSDSGHVSFLRSGKLKLTAPRTISISGDLSTLAQGIPPTINVDPSTALDSVDVSTREGAEQALETLDIARNSVLEVRTQLGAIQNRLESSVSSLSIKVENLTASDSRITDADFAKESANLTQNQILQEAGLALLAQANATPRIALDLLRQQ